MTAIMAVLIGVSTPAFRGSFSGLVLKDASLNISKLISFAQEKAIIEKVRYKLILNTEEFNYHIQREHPKDSDIFVRLDDKYGRTFSLPSNVLLKTDKAEITFYPDGRSDKARIRLVGKNKTLVVEVTGNLGYVTITDDKKTK